MPRPWTKVDDRSLRALYQRDDVAMQKIRDTLHRGTHDIHARAAVLGLVRPKRNHPASTVQRRPSATAVVKKPVQNNEAKWAVDILRRQGYSPVYAQRRSDSSMEETGLWVVGTRLLSRDEVVALALKHKLG
jgi:hypothetical protein